MEEISFKEKRIRSITKLYYSNPEIQETLFEFSKNREISPRYFEGFGKRPDSFQYPGDIFELVKKGATSFHCSEELWKDPLAIKTGMSQEEMNNLRLGWDLLIDIDSKYFDYSKVMAELIIKMLEFHGVKNIGIKFSVSGDTPILVKDNFNNIILKPISEVIDLIKKGKKLRVLSLNKERKLKFSRIYDYLEHNDIIYELKHSQSTLPLKVTGHHSVFVWDKGNIIQKKVSELKKGDFLISYNTEKNPLSIKDLKITHKYDFNKKQMINRINLTPELMRLIGYFLAEGHVTNTINQVGFTFNRNEKEYIEDVKYLLSKITKKNVSTRHPNKNSIQILIHSKQWADFFNEFCGKKKDKHTPPFSWKLTKDLFLEMLKGYIRGDGYKAGEYGIVVKSVSKKLITEFIWLCKLNGISCNLSYEKNRQHKLSQGNWFKESDVYSLRIPKSELKELEFHRKRNKFSSFPGDKIFPTDGLIQVYKHIKPKKFLDHRQEQMTLKKKNANLNRIRKVLDWFYNFKSNELDEKCSKILENYERLFSSDISIVRIKEITKKKKEKVYDVSVEDTESFFGNYYPILLHNSGSKGFHILVPWKAFPEKVNETKTSDMFPEYPRIITKYLMEKIKEPLIEKITNLTTPNKYVKDFSAPKEVMPDLVLVSPRHLFRMPYSLHEKTALASVVLNKDEIKDFDLKDANPLKITEIRNFLPDSEPGEASELLMQALDWNKESLVKASEKTKNFSTIKLSNLSNKHFPPCVQNILKGMRDGKKRALFSLINLFRTLGMDREEVEKRIYEWNEKNNPKLKEGIIKVQLTASYRKKPIMPPNCKEYYQGIGVCVPDNLCKLIKNPVNYVVKKKFLEKSNEKSKKNAR